MKLYSSLLLIIWYCLSSCQESTTQTEEKFPPSSSTKDSTLFSFTFVGCNRVEYDDWHNDSATNSSTANLSALKRVFSEISSSPKKPELFFFLGDLVLAEATTTDLNTQLKSWVDLYYDSSFSHISTSGVELVAIPGNHEMLYYKDYNIPHHDEWPLKGATEIWMQHMAQFMPSDRDKVTGPDSLVNQMTFSFVRHNVGFILMNTDTYNPPTEENPYGMEGLIPTQWIVNKVKEYQDDPTIDHVFVMGHKPYYVSGVPETGHKGLPEGPVLWPQLNDAHVVAMLSAHVHDYQRMQPGDKGTYQVIAGNGGSKGTATFFGYSTINILSNGKVQLISKGFDVGTPYYAATTSPSTIRDSTILTWSKNANPYQKQ